MSTALTPAEMATIKSTAPLLQQHGEAITESFYADLIATHPGLRDVFNSTNQATGRQARALASAVLAYATHVDDVPALAGAVARIAHKHASLMILPSQYDLVGTHLLSAIDRELGKVLGAKVPADILDAWAKAYTVLAGLFIAKEGGLFAVQRAGGWWGPGYSGEEKAASTPPESEFERGWRRFRIARKVHETSSIASFYLVPTEPLPAGRGLPIFLPGQYVSVRVGVPELGYKQCRQFSLSEAPHRSRGKGGGGSNGAGGAAEVKGEEKEGEGYYRIGVKREDEDAAARTPAGIVTNLLHAAYGVGDEVDMSHPQGEFFCDPEDASREGVPAVLISAGVGATPLIAILRSLAPLGECGGGVEHASGKASTDGAAASPAVRRPVSWIQAARSSAERPFAEEVGRIRNANDNVSVRVFLKTVAEADRQGVDYDVGGSRLDLAQADGQRDLHLGDARADYFVCGPERFMVDIRKALLGMGIARERIYLQLFGTGDVPEE